MIPRRAFLRSLALVSVAMALRPLGRGAAVDRVSSTKQNETEPALTHGGFARLRGEKFTLRTPDGAAVMVLADVKDHQRGGPVENFSVHFEGRGMAPLPQGTHRFAHRELGEFELFVVPRQIDAHTCGYEAVFNRLV